MLLIALTPIVPLLVALAGELVYAQTMATNIILEPPLTVYQLLHTPWIIFERQFYLIQTRIIVWETVVCWCAMTIELVCVYLFDKLHHPDSYRHTRVPFAYRKTVSGKLRWVVESVVYVCMWLNIAARTCAPLLRFAAVPSSRPPLMGSFGFALLLYQCSVTWRLCCFGCCSVQSSTPKHTCRSPPLPPL